MVQSLAWYGAVCGAEPWWVQGLGGSRAMVGAGSCRVQSFVRCITLVWCRALEVVFIAIPVWRLALLVALIRNFIVRLVLVIVPGVRMVPGHWPCSNSSTIASDGLLVALHRQGCRMFPSWHFPSRLVVIGFYLGRYLDRFVDRFPWH